MSLIGRPVTSNLVDQASTHVGYLTHTLLVEKGGKGEGTGSSRMMLGFMYLHLSAGKFPPIQYTKFNNCELAKLPYYNNSYKQTNKHS